MQIINEVEFKNAVGDYIKMYRKQTQEDLAEIADVSPDTISSIERGKNVASCLTLVKICNALNTTPNHILKDFITNKNATLDSIILHELLECTVEEKDFILNTIKFIKQNKIK